MNLPEEQKRVQHAVNVTLSGLRGDPWLIRRVLAGVEEEKTKGKKLSASMIIAIALIVLSITAAVAAGLGLFEKLSAGENADIRLQPLGENAEKIAKKVTTEDGVTVEIDQAFYEGNRVFVSYRLTGNVFEAEMHEGVPDRGFEWDEINEDYIMAENYMSDNTDDQKLIDMMDGRGQRWYTSRGAYLQSLDFLDGSHMELTNEDHFEKQEDGSWIGWRESLLPEGRNEEVLELKLIINYGEGAYFQDNSTFYCYSREISSTEIPFTVKRNDNLIRLEGSSETELYRARVEFTSGQIDMNGIVRVEGPGPEKWQDFWDRYEEYQESGEEVDMIITWILLHGDEEIDAIDEWVNLAGDAEVAFPRMDDLENLALAPLYSETWIHKDEAIPLTVVTEAAQ